MTTRIRTYRLLVASLTILFAAACASTVSAQGSIFGEVRNADLSVPPDGVVLFVGFIGDTDNEIRIQICVGAGYESGYWLDDFQNYIGENPGMPYRYYFFDTTAGQAALLESLIPGNSFQQEDISLAAADIPPIPTGVSAGIGHDGAINLHWADAADHTYHVYRREATSGGSFFRIDNPDGDLADPGVIGDDYSDTDLTSGITYEYVLVAESIEGDYSPASEIVYVDPSFCCQGRVGDINGIDGDTPTLGDIALLIDHLFISGTDPVCFAEADINQSGGPEPTRDDLSVGDVAILIDHLFISGLEIPYCY